MVVLKVSFLVEMSVDRTEIFWAVKLENDEVVRLDFVIAVALVAK